MSTATKSKSAAVKEKLSHPVIDGDGHWMEPTELLVDYIGKVGGTSAADAYLKIHKAINGWYDTPIEEHLRNRTMRIPWWGNPAGTLDKATTMLPDLIYNRLDDFGIDYCLMSGSRFGPGALCPDPELRKVFIRATNMLNADLFADYSDRITVSAAIPMDTPEEAVAELEYCVNELGMKYFLIASVRRTIDALRGDEDTQSARWHDVKKPYFIDTFGVDSAYDYDPFWAKCVELNVSPCTHSGSLGWADRSSVTNFTHNHIGHFAAAAHAVAKSLFLGGVTRRFPDLQVGLLECGTGWARNLQSDLAAHWAKRNKDVMMEHYAPITTDLDQLAQLVEKHGGSALAHHAQSIISQPDQTFPGVRVEELTERELKWIDDFAAVQVNSKQEVREEFARAFYFGCEADDPMTMQAFDSRFDTKLKAMFGSDIGHFDVIDMTEVLEEAHEMVDYGWINEDEFREFTFENAVGLHGGTNPDFFKGTVIESAVDEELARQKTEK